MPQHPFLVGENSASFPRLRGPGGIKEAGVVKNDMKNIRNPVFSGIHHHLSTDST
jgi:hypothetical protein